RKNPHHIGDIIRIRKFRSVRINLIKVEHVLTEGHGLKIKLPPHGKKSSHMPKKILVNLVLFARPALFGGTKMLESTEAHGGIESSQVFGLHRSAVFNMSFEALALTGLQLPRGKSEPHSFGPDHLQRREKGT